MVFLFVHFGKHHRAGWRYAREVYGRLGDGSRWDWASTSANPSSFRGWLAAHQGELRREGIPRGFGNHRKYESLDARSPKGTGAAVESYVEWVNPPRTHQEMMEEARRNAEGNPRRTFAELYQSMRVVARFGRTARFDYLTMIGKLGLGAIEPPSTYMGGATGPIRGARLLAWASFSQVDRSERESKASSNLIALVGKSLASNPRYSIKNLNKSWLMTAQYQPKITYSFPVFDSASLSLLTN